MIPTFTVKLMNEQLLFYYYNEHTTCLLAVQITHNHDLWAYFLKGSSAPAVFYCITVI